MLIFFSALLYYISFFEQMIPMALTVVELFLRIRYKALICIFLVGISSIELIQIIFFSENLREQVISILSFLKQNWLQI